MKTKGGEWGKYNRISVDEKFLQFYLLTISEWILRTETEWNLDLEFFGLAFLRKIGGLFALLWPPEFEFLLESER